MISRSFVMIAPLLWRSRSIDRECADSGLDVGGETHSRSRWVQRSTLPAKSLGRPNLPCSLYISCLTLIRSPARSYKSEMAPDQPTVVLFVSLPWYLVTVKIYLDTDLRGVVRRISLCAKLKASRDCDVPRWRCWSRARWYWTRND